MENTIKDLLIKLGISSNDSFEPYYNRVRDRDDIKVLKCKKSGVIILNRTDHINENYYGNADQWVGDEDENRKKTLNECKKDDYRRIKQIEDYIRNKIWIDYGTGAGGILSEGKKIAKTVYAVEKQKKAIKQLKREIGFEAVENLSDIQKAADVITMFHVLEHLKYPTKVLKEIYDKLLNDGVAIVEVPHARDFLLSFIDSEPFKKSFLWSEHLILHTRQSLESFLREAGFQRICINSLQRYPLSNHIGWLKDGKSRGHERFSFLNIENLKYNYEQALSMSDMCDTLIAFAFKK